MVKSLPIPTPNVQHVKTLSFFFSSYRVSVSRAIKPFSEPGRPPDWFSQKVLELLKVFIIHVSRPLRKPALRDIQPRDELFLDINAAFFSLRTNTALRFTVFRAAGDHGGAKVSVTDSIRHTPLTATHKTKL